MLTVDRGVIAALAPHRSMTAWDAERCIWCDNRGDQQVASNGFDGEPEIALIYIAACTNADSETALFGFKMLGECFDGGLNIRRYRAALRIKLHRPFLRCYGHAAACRPTIPI